MANKLPITDRDIITPYVVAAEEPAAVSVALNNTVRVVRSIAHRFVATLTLRPYRALIYEHDAATISGELPADQGQKIATFLAKNPSFQMPVFNNRPNPNTAGVTTSGANVVNDYTINVTSDIFFIGQYIRFNGFTKLYQIADVGVGTITLAQPLRHAVSSLTPIIYKETYDNGTTFNGVMGTFTNLDFGLPLQRVEGGVLMEIGPLNLVETL